MQEVLQQEEKCLASSFFLSGTLPGPKPGELREQTETQNMLLYVHSEVKGSLIQGNFPKGSEVQTLFTLSVDKFANLPVNK